MKTFNITHIQLFEFTRYEQINDDGDYHIVHSYSANIIINDRFVVQVSGNKEESTFDGICDPNLAYWKTEEDQNNACENIDDSDLKEALESKGFENNHYWLSENSDEINKY